MIRSDFIKLNADVDFVFVLCFVTPMKFIFSKHDIVKLINVYISKFNYM